MNHLPQHPYPAPGQMPEPRTTGTWLRDHGPRIAPGLTTTTVLILARVWNANGAEHSIGNAILMGALSLGSAAAGYVSANGRHGHEIITATAFTGSGALALAGVAAYSDGLPLPLLLWVLATAAVYALAARHWREDKRDALAHDRTYALRSLERGTDLQIAAVDAQARIEVAREATAYATQLTAAILERHAISPGTIDTGQILASAGVPLPQLAPTVDTSRAA
ncbi:hypothetical protein ACGFX4_12540 [Kitasatospora sp. NPDC048365]|uniref:hypothetical protein n=1 Tax=Kitasatospora sp. NPDC048365 TaxID=3364050 RepID=UPI00371A30C6